MSNYMCQKCGGRWLPRESEFSPPTNPHCPWCELVNARLQLAAEQERRQIAEARLLEARQP